MKKKIIIVGLGPGPLDMMTAAAHVAMREADVVFVQTERHPAVPALRKMGIRMEPLDELYQNAEDFDALNDAIAQKILQCAAQKRTVLAVSGHGLTGQTASAALVKQAPLYGIEVIVKPGLSFEDAALAACRLCAANGYAVHTGVVHPESMDSSVVNIVVDMDTKVRASECKIALMQRYADETQVYFVQADAAGMESRSIKLWELDRQALYNAQSATVLPAQTLLEKQRFTAADLWEICRILRGPGGCPWDRVQTHGSIRRNMMEECCEAMAAISEGDDEHLCEELGDVMLQVALHSVMAREEGAFDFTDVATGICQKMIRRHPHIFGQEHADTPEAVLLKWESIKEKERNGESVNPLKKVGEGLPSLMRAQELQKTICTKADDLTQARAALTDAALILAQDANMEAAEEHAGEALWALCRLLGILDVHAETVLCDRCTEEIERHSGLKLLLRNEENEENEYEIDQAQKKT